MLKALRGTINVNKGPFFRSVGLEQHESVICGAAVILFVLFMRMSQYMCNSVFELISGLCNL